MAGLSASGGLTGFFLPHGHVTFGIIVRLIESMGKKAYNTGIRPRTDYQSMKTWLLVGLLIIIGTVTNASCSSSDNTSDRPTIERIGQRGKILVGTTGDYRPLSFREPETGEYWGFGIEMAWRLLQDWVSALSSYRPPGLPFRQTCWQSPRCLTSPSAASPLPMPGARQC